MTYSDILRPVDSRRALIYDVLLVALGAVFIALMARVTIYTAISPVPITGQTLAVLLIGAVLGSCRGAFSVLTYIGYGVAGMPVFAGGLAGPAVLIGPTGGYLVGFVAAAFVVGLLAERDWDTSPWLTALAMIIGSVIIYLFGATWLGVVAGFDYAWAAGVVPFLIGDALKVGIAMLLLPAGWQLVGGLASHTS